MIAYTMNSTVRGEVMKKGMSLTRASWAELDYGSHLKVVLEDILKSVTDREASIS
jgi:hypothetical protein